WRLAGDGVVTDHIKVGREVITEVNVRGVKKSFAADCDSRSSGGRAESRNHTVNTFSNGNRIKRGWGIEIRVFSRNPASRQYRRMQIDVAHLTGPRVQIVRVLDARPHSTKPCSRGNSRVSALQSAVDVKVPGRRAIVLDVVPVMI